MKGKRKQTLHRVELNYDQQVHRLIVDHQNFVDLIQILIVEMVKELEEVLDELM